MDLCLINAEAGLCSSGTNRDLFRICCDVKQFPSCFVNVSLTGNLSICYLYFNNRNRLYKILNLSLKDIINSASVDFSLTTLITFLQILSYNHVFVFWFCGFSLGLHHLHQRCPQCFSTSLHLTHHLSLLCILIQSSGHSSVLFPWSCRRLFLTLPCFLHRSSRLPSTTSGSTFSDMLSP